MNPVKGLRPILYEGSKYGLKAPPVEALSQLNNVKTRKYAIFRAFSIPKILSGLFGFDGI